MKAMVVISNFTMAALSCPCKGTLKVASLCNSDCIKTSSVSSAGNSEASLKRKIFLCRPVRCATCGLFCHCVRFARSLYNNFKLFN